MNPPPVTFGLNSASNRLWYPGEFITDRRDPGSQPLAEKDGMPGVAYQWLEIEGPLPDDVAASGAGHRLVISERPMRPRASSWWRTRSASRPWRAAVVATADAKDGNDLREAEANGGRLKNGAGESFANALTAPPGWRLGQVAKAASGWKQ